MVMEKLLRAAGMIRHLEARKISTKIRTKSPMRVPMETPKKIPLIIPMKIHRTNPRPIHLQKFSEYLPDLIIGLSVRFLKTRASILAVLETRFTMAPHSPKICSPLKVN
jgi:hypothetical protein